jgi:hypothetical protein
MEQWEIDKYDQNQIIKEKIISYIKEKINSGELTNINEPEMASIEFGKTIYDEKMNMYLIEENIWNKLPTHIQEEITALTAD